jgi:ubiquinone biosynthesis protein UbiJ
MAMWSVLALGACERLLNQMLELDQISRIKLNRLHGQCLRVVLDAPSLSLDVFFDLDKLRLEPTALGQASGPSLFEQRPFDPQQASQVANTTLHCPDLVALAKLLLSPEQAIGNVPVQGDYQLLFALKAIFFQLEIHLAAYLSPWIGASAAHEIGKLQQLPKQLRKVAKSAEFMLSDSLKEDSGLLAARWQSDELQRNTRLLHQQIDRLEAKLQQLQQHLTPPSSPPA